MLVADGPGERTAIVAVAAKLRTWDLATIQHLRSEYEGEHYQFLHQICNFRASSAYYFAR